MVRRLHTSATPPAHDARQVDRFSEVVSRARAEFLEMPGLKLTSAQAARLWAIDLVQCQAVLNTLVETQFLIRTRDEGFQRA